MRVPSLIPKYLIQSVALLGLLFTATVTAAGWYDDKPDVTVLENLQQFEETVLKSPALWMIQFCTRREDVCQKMATNYGVMGSLYKGIIHFGVVDMGTPGGIEIVQKFNVPPNTIPSLYWFLDDKEQPTKIESLLEMETMVGHIMSTMATTITNRAEKLGLGIQFSGGNKEGWPKGGKSGGGSGGKKSKGEKKTVTVTGEAEWEEKVINNPLVTMVAFAAPWCGHCKMLQPEYDEAAAKVDGEGAQLVWVDATDDANRNIASQFNVQGFPTVVVFPGGAPKNPSMARQYPGDRKASAIVKYVLGEVDVSGVPKEIPQLISSDVLKAECQGTNHICVLAALPHILDSGASGRNNYKELVQKVSKTFRGGAFSFLWFQGGDQPALETALEMTFGYPALVAYSMDRHAFAVLHGSFSEKSMTSFLHGVTSGRVPVVKLAQEKVPKIETTEEWDGLDAAPPEEEFSLDDIMGSSDDDDESGKDEL